ncbi:hypothetical protein PENANT_c025G00654 [Penicillium antarcticum]|uniref:Uncharacterized protein n=1 Tax=Penicillium antarcticum TaxID=416450 RepID=A0A1V6PXU6_9EURO|nr:hypothetical protein PENANT_c025G00654 [Penicillium antarcticum]
MSPSEVRPSAKELGDNGFPSTSDAAPASNILVPTHGKATSAVFNHSQLPEYTTIIEPVRDSECHPLPFEAPVPHPVSSEPLSPVHNPLFSEAHQPLESSSPDSVEQLNTYRLVSSTQSTTVPGLTPARDIQPDRTTVNPKYGVTQFAWDQIESHLRFIERITNIRAERIIPNINMPDTNSEVFDLYYSLAEQCEALEIEIGLPPSPSLPENTQSVAKLPAIARLNFYREELGREKIGSPPSACDFHRGPRPDSIKVRGLHFLGQYCKRLTDVKEAFDEEAEGLRACVIKKYEAERDDPNNSTVSDINTELIDALVAKVERGEATTVRLPQKKKKRNKGIKKRRKPAKKGNQENTPGLPPQCQPQFESEAAAPCEFDTEVAVEPKEKALKEKNNRKGGKAAKVMAAQVRVGRYLTQESSEAETDSFAADTEHLSKAKSMAMVSEEKLGAPVPGNFIYESDTDSRAVIPTPGSSEPFTGLAALSQEISTDPPLPLPAGRPSTGRRSTGRSSLERDSTTKKHGKLERALVSSVSIGNAEKMIGAEDPTPSPPTPPIPTPPQKLAALSTAESGSANPDEIDADARGIEGETATWSLLMNPWARPDTAAGRLLDAQYHRSGVQIVSSEEAVTREERLTEPEGSCRASGFGDCCHCLGTHGASAELLSEHPDGALIRPWVPR